jgi:hypothetical protein
MRRNECLEVFKINIGKSKYINDQQMHINIFYVFYSMCSAACFGRYSDHFQGDVIIKRIQHVPVWLNASPSLHNN